ncbi:hypothetical protein OEA41_005690 [Lepraria neglecta]|uniref:AMP-dependent synthetase/ligase domain-containing protein n=1 Tax=Lepraria neglecta TaxID=209136 RepID=A0AAD9Z6H9_9LECA|nr:hypothetical protein OEA41_005690 [Lepraria neglecta]
MSSHDTHGARLITSTIDYYAAEAPDKIYASVPRSEDLSDGFFDVSYKQFADAINHASWWLDSMLGKCNGSFDTFAYAGPKDLRYPVLAVAATKVGRKILLPSSFVTAAAQIHLLEATGSQAYLCAASNRADVELLVKGRSSMRVIDTPDDCGWLIAQDAKHYPYTKTWEEAKNDPWIIFHTSGTTGKS